MIYKVRFINREEVVDFMFSEIDERRGRH